MRRRVNDEQGFTLLEIMASIVILSVVALTLSGFFIQAMSYSKQNQSKTIAVHLARNALASIQKEPFAPLRAYLAVPDAGGGYSVLDGSRCEAECAGYAGLVRDPSVLSHVLRPEVNGVAYVVRVSYQPDLAPYLDIGPDAEDEGRIAAAGAGEEALSAYLLPIQVEVAAETGGRSDPVRVEGYLTDETIR
ncbi:type II secretion system protein [Paenibacillus albicereus]|uniref:Type II secretion system protein n=1 Tax=Paenibacillus albicereus TaxID=2726185 RepID=A0A6H2GSQ1_9BACL|nr:type II secretion system protein [Paenibacillus albicereus]QJC50206.1 type II secretion system protein [Paenibacillus albicereus]